MTREKLDELIEREKWLTFDSVDPSYHGDLLKALTELKDFQESCEDCISREAALAMSDYIGEAPTYDNPLGIVEEVVRVKDIMALPPVAPVPGKAKWIKHDTGHSVYYDCSLCGCCAPCTETADKTLWKLSNFCPDCGAEMEAADGD